MLIVEGWLDSKHTFKNAKEKMVYLPLTCQLEIQQVTYSTRMLKHLPLQEHCDEISLTGVFNSNDLHRRNCRLTFCVISHIPISFYPSQKKKYHFSTFQLISITVLAVLFGLGFLGCCWFCCLFGFICFSSYFQSFMHNFHSYFSNSFTDINPISIEYRWSLLKIYWL